MTWTCHAILAYSTYIFMTVRCDAPRVIWYDCVILYESSELCKREVLWFMGSWRERVMSCGDFTHLIAVRELCEGVRSCEELWRKRVMSCGDFTHLIAVRELCEGVRSCEELWRKRVMSCGDFTHLIAVRELCEGVRSCEELWRKRVMSCGDFTHLIAVRELCEGVRSCEELWRKRVMSCGDFTHLIAVRELCEVAQNCIKMWRKRVTRCNFISASFWNFLFYVFLYGIVKFISQLWHKLCRNVKVPKNRRGEFFSSPRHR